MKTKIEEMRKEYRELRSEAIQRSNYTSQEYDQLIEDMMTVNEYKRTPKNYLSTAKEVTDAIEEMAEADAMMDWYMDDVRKSRV